jgi:hypothetical protein
VLAAAWVQYGQQCVIKLLSDVLVFELLSRCLSIRCFSSQVLCCSSRVVQVQKRVAAVPLSGRRDAVLLSIEWTASRKVGGRRDESRAARYGGKYLVFFSWLLTMLLGRWTRACAALSWSCCLAEWSAAGGVEECCSPCFGETRNGTKN